MTIALASLPDRTGDSLFIETLLQDKDGVIDDLIERYHTNELRSLFCQNAAANINRGNDCLIPNYADLPAPKINQLVIPTGATRWSYCLLLADTAIKERIDTASDFGVKQMNLIYGSPVGSDPETDHIISLTVSILTPRRVSPNLDDDNNDLWLIPVVDTRYWWQFMFADDFASEVTDGMTPDELVNLLAEKIPEEILNVKVCPLYKLLPTCATTNDNENLPILLDSVCANYGQRLVVDIGCWGGEDYVRVNEIQAPAGQTTFAVIDGDNSRDVLAASLVGEIGLEECVWNADSPYTPELLKTAAREYPVVFKAPKFIAGNRTTGKYAIVPNSVSVQTYSGDFSVITLDEILHPNEDEPDFEDPIWKELQLNSFQDVSAIWRTKFEGTAESEDDLKKLKTQIARDYYYQFLHQFDYTIAGVQPWQQGYFDDYMVIRQSFNTATGAYDAYTRVCSRQPNLTGEWAGEAHSGPIWAVNIGTLSVPSLTVTDGVLTGKVTGNAAPFSRNSDSDLRISTKRLEFERWSDGGEIADGTLIMLDRVNGKLTIVFANCAPTEDLTGLDP